MSRLELAVSRLSAEMEKYDENDPMVDPLPDFEDISEVLKALGDVCKRGHLQSMCSDGNGDCIECSVVEIGYDAAKSLQSTQTSVRDRERVLSRGVDLVKEFQAGLCEADSEDPSKPCGCCDTIRSDIHVFLKDVDDLGILLGDADRKQSLISLLHGRLAELEANCGALRVAAAKRTVAITNLSDHVECLEPSDDRGCPPDSDCPYCIIYSLAPQDVVTEALKFLKENGIPED